MGETVLGKSVHVILAFLFSHFIFSRSFWDIDGHRERVICFLVYSVYASTQGGWIGSVFYRIHDYPLSPQTFEGRAMGGWEHRREY